MEELSSVVENTEVMDLGYKSVDAAEPQEINAADLLAGDQQQQPDKTVTETTEVDAPVQVDKERDMQAAFGREMQRIRQTERQKYEQQLAQDKARNIGMLLIQEIMQRQGVDENNAIRIAEENYWKSKGEEMNLHPTIARQLLDKQAPKQEPENIQSKADRIKAEAAELKATNGFPEGFDYDKSIEDVEFVKLLNEMPLKAAARVYRAEQTAKNAPQDLAEKLQARESIPKPLKPQQTNTPTIDYSSMSDEAFMALDAQIKDARMRGIKVKY
jgi:hypothetical protein